MSRLPASRATRICSKRCSLAPTPPNARRQERTPSWVFFSPTSAGPCAGKKAPSGLADARFLRVPAVRLQDC